MQRRKFIKSSLALGSSILLPSTLYAFDSDKSNTRLSRIVISKDSLLQSSSLDGNRLQKILEAGMQVFFNTDRTEQAWKKIVKPGENVGLKVNCLSGKGSTHRELVDLVCDQLQNSGVRAENIIIWDRFNSDLEDGGFRINQEGKGIRCFGNEYLGFGSDFESHGSAASLVCNTLIRACDVVINLPVLKDHGIAGMTMSMKNMFGAIHNPNKYHLATGNPYIADVFMLPSIRTRVRLTIADAISAQYEGGPSFMPHWRWAFNGLIIGTDPVALDYCGWQILDAERKKRGIKSLKEAGREPKYIITAADADHRLGTCDPNKIEQVTLE